MSKLNGRYEKHLEQDEEDEDEDFVLEKKELKVKNINKLGRRKISISRLKC